MGIVRTLLAISVVFSHAANQFTLVGGANAVQAFYIISGFLISFVLSKEVYKTKRQFWKNRFLRMYPVYIVVACIGCLLMGKVILQGILGLPWLGKLLLIMANLTMVGQDWILFMAVNDGVLSFTKTFFQSDPHLYSLLLIPQGWTIGVELSFYFLAPFIVKNKKLLITLFILSLGGRMWAITEGWGSKDPWTYRFFPFELALFIMGVFSHQLLYEKFKFYMNKTVANLAFIMALLFILLFPLVPNSHRALPSILFFVAIVIIVPGLFTFQNNFRIDKQIGELSYPIYISHMLIIWNQRNYFVDIGFLGIISNPMAYVLQTIILSLILKIFIADPVEKYRLKVKLQG